MRKLLFTLVILVLALTGCCNSDANKATTVRVINGYWYAIGLDTINGHEYVVIYTSNGADIEHSEACWCFDETPPYFVGDTDEGV